MRISSGSSIALYTTLALSSVACKCKGN